MSGSEKTLEQVKNYYGQELKNSSDLKTSACESSADAPEHIKSILASLPDEVLAKYYGCGSPLPEVLTGARVLDLGCGSGRDVFTIAAMVGSSGHVVGIDMTEEQLEVPLRHQAAVAKKLGYNNTTFVKGYIEDLAGAGLEDNSFDLVVSNCVVNLSPDKARVLSEIYRVLKPGGELYFADVYSDRRLAQPLLEDPMLWGECLSGALYEEDFRRLMQKVGFQDHRLCSRSLIDIADEAIAAKLAPANFYSLTVRAFKLDCLEDRCEDYGQIAIYKGSIPRHPGYFMLDDHHVFEKGKPMLVCQNTAAMLSQTRYAPHFTIIGDISTHFGLFDCAAPIEGPAETNGSGCC